MHTQNRTEGKKKKKKSQAPATCSWISFSLCSKSFVLLQAARAAVEPEWECASIAKAQDTALFLPSHGEGGGQGGVAGEHFGKIFQNDKSPLPQPLHAQESCPPSHLQVPSWLQAKGWKQAQCSQARGPVKEMVVHSYNGVLQNYIYKKISNWLSLLKREVL